jgi:hypothetical protein
LATHAISNIDIPTILYNTYFPSLPKPIANTTNNA